MESLQRMPSKITNTHLKFHVLLQEIEAQIVQFTDLPSDTPGLHLLSQNIVQKLVVLKNKFTADTVSQNPLPDDLLEIEAKLRDLEAEFYQSNIDSTFEIGDYDDDVSENGSVCESCLNYDPQVNGDDVSSVHEVPEMVDEDEVMMPPLQEKSGKRRRRWWWWWRTVVILMPASVVCAVCYFDMKQHEGFLVPT